MSESNSKISSNNERPILVSQEDIENRRRTHSDALANFAVDNIPINPDTKHIFNDYVEGRIVTTKEVKELLHAHYTKAQSQINQK
ncbi:antitoxin VbhA family protein [Psychrobacter sp. AOP3-A1-26]|uniref:antitoxin VbhA family protein n=1 Tax=Psychrobacter sp. AOP3-A1-26 TaxID=3457700 RepID=UPI004035DD82